MPEHSDQRIAVSIDMSICRQMDARYTPYLLTNTVQIIRITLYKISIDSNPANCSF